MLASPNMRVPAPPVRSGALRPSLGVVPPARAKAGGAPGKPIV